MKSIINILFFISLCGCQTIYKTIYGAKNPSPKSDKEITKWFKKRITTDEHNIYTLTPDSYQETMFDYFKKPYIFRTNGEFVALGRSNNQFYCAPNFGIVLQNTVPFDSLKRDPGNYLIRRYMTLSADHKDTVKHQVKIFPKLSDLDSVICDLKGIKAKIIVDTTVDYILLLPFGLFLGKRYYNKDLKTYYEAAKNNPRVKFQFIFLNIDMQEWWGEEWVNKFNIRM